MRILEILLLLANLLAFLGLVLTLPGAWHWIRYSALIATLVAGAQDVVEGYRWPMLPAYTLAGLFTLTWLLQNRAQPGVTATLSQANRLAYGMATGIGIIGLGVSFALPVLIPIFRFPQPTGPYKIGTVAYHWVDTSRPEIFTADPNDRRELIAQIWYPTRADTQARRAIYVPDADVLASEFVRVQRRPASRFLFGSLRYVTSNAIPSAPVADDQPSYPVLIFLEGATGFRQMNTFQVEELASQGYIVVAIDQPHSAAVVVFPDGRQVGGLPREQLHPLIRQSYIPAETPPVLNGQALKDGIIPYLAQDLSFTLDLLVALNRVDPKGILTGRLDLQREGVFGFSLGGIVAGEACLVEPRLRACLILDAPVPASVVASGLKVPAMWITRDAGVMRLERQRAGGWSEEEIHAHLTSMRATYESLKAEGYFVQVDGIFHSNFSDVPAWSPLVRWLGSAGPMDVQRAHRIINAYTVAFFDRELKGLPAALLDGPAEEFPEVSFEKRP